MRLPNMKNEKAEDRETNQPTPANFIANKVNSSFPLLFPKYHPSVFPLPFSPLANPLHFPLKPVVVRKAQCQPFVENGRSMATLDNGGEMAG